MASSDTYAFFLDIDNTLVYNGEISPRSRAAIAAARAKGHLVLINTARSLSNIQPVVTALALDGIVSSLGSNVTLGGKTLFADRIPTEEWAAILDRWNEKGLNIMLEGDDLLASNNVEKWPELPLVRTGAEYRAKYGDRVVAKAYIPHVLAPDVRAELEERYVFFQHDHYAEIAPKGRSKAAGMLAAAEHFGIDRAHLVAMGDSLNDMDMLRAAGIAVAMGNAVDEVKDICTMITCHAGDGGVGEGICRVLHMEL